MDPLIDPGEYAALAYCTYLNQASLGLIPRTSVEASVRFLTDVAQHGNLRLSDQAEARVLDGLRTAAAGLLGAPVASVAVVGGASEGLGQLAALLSSAGGEVVLVASDFPRRLHFSDRQKVVDVGVTGVGAVQTEESAGSRAQMPGPLRTIGCPRPAL
jgi:kynureninase